MKLRFTGLCLVVLYSMITTSAGLRCLSCEKETDLAECFRTEAQCEDGQEECYLTKMMLPDMTIAFRAGCKAEKVCSFNEHSIANGRRQMVWIKGTMEYGLCHECCKDGPDKDGIPCNGHLCGQQPNISTTHVWCAECDKIRDPAKCSRYVQCPINEVCLQEEIVSAGQLTYNLGCQRKEICDRVLNAYMSTHTKRTHGDVHICSACCSTRDCNQGRCDVIRRREGHRSTCTWSKRPITSY